MEHNEIKNDEMLAVLHSDVKKLIKHFRIDRRSQNDAGPATETEPAPDTALLQSIADGVRELSERKVFTKEQMDSMYRVITEVGKFFYNDPDGHHAELKSLLEIISGKLDERAAEPQKSTVRKEYYFTVDFKNSKAVLTIVVLAVFLIISLWGNFWQYEKNAVLKDNDLKYRFIEMREGISGEDLFSLRDIFGYNRNKNQIKKIRQSVNDYEKLVREQAEKATRARLNAAEAERLRLEAETVKGN